MKTKIVHESHLIQKVTKILAKVWKQPAIIGSAIATVLVVGMQKIELLQTMELRVYDQMMQMRSDPGPDPRLLVVAITEQDLQKWGWPLSGEVLDRLLGQLEEYQPRGIGLDILRDLPVQPGHEKLLQRLQLSDLIIPVCKHADAQGPGVPPPQGIEPKRVGFSDIIEDTDGFIRRNLISVNVDEAQSCQSPYSFSWQLALKYLAVAGIRPQLTPNQELQLRDVVFKPLESNSGGYENADTQGYQILLNYRSPRQIAQQVTITQVLTGEIKPDLVKERIVLIGSTAPSLKDFFNTPFNSGTANDSGRITGIEIHGQIISQILSAVLNNQGLFWFLPGWGEVLWIGAWSTIGGLLAGRIRHPLGLGLAETTSLAILFGGNFVIFTQGGWLPVVAPALGLVVATGSVLAYSLYQIRQDQEKVLQRVQEQADLIAQLQVYMSETPSRGATQSMGADNSQTVASPQSETPSMQQAQGVTPYVGQKLAVNTILNQCYKITKSLGSGGFGNTYLAQDIQRARNSLCVVKQLRPASQDPKYLNVVRRLFNNEAYILEKLGKNPQIPEFIAYFEENQQFYLVQEFIDGHPLTQELTPGVSCSRDQVINILQEVLQVLTFIHSYGVIHRDVKPDNLIRSTKDMHIVLIDFGAVKQVQPQSQEENHTIAIGTSGYAPGEQMSGIPRLNSDIYALGIIAIQALTGLSPKVFRRDVKTGLITIPKVSPSGNPVSQDWWDVADTTQELTDILNRMVHLDFTQRYQSAANVLNDINRNVG